MTAIRSLLPATTLGRVRLAGTVYVFLSVLPQFLQLDVHHSGPVRLAAPLGLLVLAGDATAAFVRRRTYALEPLVVGAALVASGAGFRDPLAVTAVCTAVAMSLSLYDPVRLAVPRLLLIVAALPATLAIAPVSLGRHIVWSSPQVMGMLPGIAVTGLLMRALLASVQRQDAAHARDRILARTGNRLLNQTDDREVAAIIREAAAELCAANPGTCVLAVRHDGDTVVVIPVAGAATSETRTLPAAEWNRDLESMDARGTPPPHLRDLFDGLSPERRHWRGVTLGTHDADRYLVVGGLRTVPDEVFDAFRTLGTQWSIAHARSDAHSALAHRAHHDQLTGLPNRSLLFQLLTDAVDAVSPAGSAPPTLLLIDLDDFKQVNDIHGHAAGDDLLVVVGQRLTALAGDHASPARLGGDEFALLLTGLTSEDADAVAGRVADLLREPVPLTAATVHVRASIGLAVASPDLTAGDLMRCADIAMYSAKARGKNRVERFRAEVNGDVAELRMLEEHLPHALERGEVTPYFQPIIALDTGRCVGVEALARWHHPRLGLVQPGTFIPLAERTGCIVALGAEILRRAVGDFTGWCLRTGVDDLRLAVNVAPQQLALPGFVDVVAETLDRAGLEPHRLTLEVTESEIVDETTALQQLHALDALGVRIAIDDFGTGYASLAALRSFPVDQLKIDRTYLPSDSSSTDREMLELIVSMGRVLELETVAEGAETAAQVDTLLRAGVPLAQGFFFGHPMPLEELTGWWDEHQRCSSDLVTDAAPGSE